MTLNRGQVVMHKKGLQLDDISWRRERGQLALEGGVAGRDISEQVRNVLGFAKQNVKVACDCKFSLVSWIYREINAKSKAEINRAKVFRLDMRGDA